MKKKLGLAAFLVMVLTLFAFPRLASADTYVSGDITSDTTWDVAGSPYHMTGNISVYRTDGFDGVTTLTLQPGVEVGFPEDAHLQIGYGAQPGKLVADVSRVMR